MFAITLTPAPHQHNCCHVRQHLLIASFLPACLDPFLWDKSPHRRPYLRSPPDTRHLPRSSSLCDASDSHRSLPLLSLHLSHPPRGPLASLTFKPARVSTPLQNLAGARAACSPSLHDFLTPQRSFPPAQATPAHSLPLRDRGLTSCPSHHRPRHHRLLCRRGVIQCSLAGWEL